jgi:hypothetical protein
MFQTEIKAHAQEILSHMVSAWFATHKSVPEPGEARAMADKAVEFAKIFSELATPQE